MDIVRIAATTIKNHVPLWPLVGLTATAMSMAAVSIIRHGVKHPEVAFNRKSDSRPWERIKPGTQIKFFDPVNRRSGILKDEGNQRPNYKG